LTSQVGSKIQVVELLHSILSLLKLLYDGYTLVCHNLAMESESFEWKYINRGKRQDWSNFISGTSI